MKSIVVGNLKGGVGKTTTVINLAYTFAQMGKRVLVIDTDPQCNTTSLFANVNSFEKSLESIITHKYPIKKCIYRTKYKQIDIIKGNTTLDDEDVCDMNWFDAVQQEVGELYDICLVDTRPTFGRLTESAVTYADMLLTPVCMDKFCKDNLALVEDHIYMYLDNGLDWRVFATKINFRRKSQNRIYQDIMETHSYPFLESCISLSSIIENALEQEKPVLRHRSKSQPAVDYMELAEELLEIMDINQGEESSRFITISENQHFETIHMESEVG